MLQQHQSHLGDAPASLHFFCISPTSAQEDPENWNKAALLITRTEVHLGEFLTRRILLLTFNREEKTLWPLPRGIQSNSRTLKAHAKKMG